MQTTSLRNSQVRINKRYACNWFVVVNVASFLHANERGFDSLAALVSRLNGIEKMESTAIFTANCEQAPKNVVFEITYKWHYPNIPTNFSNR